MKIIFKYQILYAVLLFVSVDNIAQNYGQYEKDCDARCKYEKYMKKQNSSSGISSTSFLDLGLSLDCISRDRDGISPFAIAYTEKFSAENTILVFDTLDECESALSKDLMVIPGADDFYLICATQDEDGLSPYGLFSYEISTGEIYKEDYVYDSIANCETAITEAYQEGESLYVCTSVDDDGIAPWGIIEVGVGFVGDEFETFQACMNRLNS